MKKLLYILIVLFALPGFARGQEKFGSASYSMGFGTGNTNDFIDHSSFGGFQFEFGSYFSQELLSASLQVGYQSFYKEFAKSTYDVSNGAITGKQYRYLHAVPILINGLIYPLGQDGVVIPQVGIGVGTYHIDKNMDMGIYSYSQSKWHFGLAPRAGICIPINLNTYFEFNGQYNMAFKAGSGDAANWLSLSFGVRFIY